MSFKLPIPKSNLSDEQLYDTVETVIMYNFKNMPYAEDIKLPCSYRKEFNRIHYQNIYKILNKYFNNNCDIHNDSFDRSSFFLDEINAYEMYYSNVSESSFSILIKFMLSKKNKERLIIQIQKLNGCSYNFTLFLEDLMNVIYLEYYSEDDDFIPPPPKLRRQSAIFNTESLDFKNNTKIITDPIQKDNMKKYIKCITQYLRKGKTPYIGDIVIAICSDVNYLAIMSENMNDKEGNLLVEMIKMANNKDTYFKRYLQVAFKRILQGNTFIHETILRKLEVIKAMTMLGFNKRSL